MPEEVLDTKDEKVSDVKLEKKETFSQKLGAKMRKSKFWGPIIKAFTKSEEKKAKIAKKKAEKEAKKEAKREKKEKAQETIKQEETKDTTPPTPAKPKTAAPKKTTTTTAKPKTAATKPKTEAKE